MIAEGTLMMRTSSPGACTREDGDASHRMVRVV